MADNREALIGLLTASIVPPVVLGARALTTSGPGVIDASGAQAFLVIALFVYAASAVLAIAIGYPIFLLLRHLGYVNWWSAILAGGLIGALFSGYLWAQHSSAETLASYSLLGMLAGFTFWLVYRRGLARAARAPSK